VEIVSGLFPGDEVVTRGAYPLAFAGSGSGLSLKEALDAAHGHEHNENGTDMIAQQKSESSNTDANDQSNGEATDGALDQYLIFYAATMTLLTALFAQRLWNKRKDMVTA
jgi:cobalt-zinc-cadmium efflux system membrane fusion protein